MLTKDHIFPRILGGLDTLNNYQVLCERCNACKGNKTDLTADEAIARKAGARGLRAIVEDIMIDVMFDVPSDEVSLTSLVPVVFVMVVETILRYCCVSPI